MLAPYSTPQISRVPEQMSFPLGWVTGPSWLPTTPLRVSLFPDAAGSFGRWTFKVFYNLFSSTHYCGSGCHFSPTWGTEGGSQCQEVTVDTSAQLYSADTEPDRLQASMTPNRKKAWYTMPGNTQNLMFHSSLWKLDNCPSVSLYVLFMVACSVLLPHMCFFIGCCKLENIINSFGFRDSLKMISA